MAPRFRKLANALSRALHQPMKRFYNRLPGLSLIALAVFVSAVSVSQASSRRLSDLENIQFQIIIMFIGIAGSYLLGGVTAREAAMDIVRPHAKSAFRRVVSLYESLRRLLYTMEKLKTSLDGNHQAIEAIERFQDLVTEQLSTSGDTIEDWSDLVPDEVAKLKERATRESPTPSQ